MSKNSDHVKAWRKRCKEKIVAAFGGSCGMCGYSKCTRALAFHHLDPNQKDLSLASIRATPRKWSVIVAELQKCVMLCHNCHSEIHEGISTIPIEIKKFDESSIPYKELFLKDKSFCPVCGHEKPPHQKHCSVSCSSKSRFKVDWDNIDIAEMLKTKSVIALSEELGCSDAAIHKRMIKLGLKQRSNRKTRIQLI
jgi:hypothetical protein